MAASVSQPYLELVENISQTDLLNYSGWLEVLKHSLEGYLHDMLKEAKDSMS